MPDRTAGRCASRHVCGGQRKNSLSHIARGRQNSTLYDVGHVLTSAPQANFGQSSPYGFSLDGLDVKEVSGVESMLATLLVPKENPRDHLLCDVLGKPINGIYLSPNPLPKKSKHRRFVLLQIFQPWQWKRRKKRNRFEQTSRTLQRKISISTKDQLLKRCSYAGETQCFPVEHVEEVPSHDGETV
ncbi:hypothetical protein TNCV_3844281 [Trichonephila clavipes]|nr:hypothetical protein TNCV_3844281 [Trichonephila clavipes]